MAKDRSAQNTEQTAADVAVEGQTQAAPAAAATTTASNVIMVTDPDTNTPVRRTDYIRKCAAEKGMTRGQIAKHLTELNGKAGIFEADGTTPKKVPYQAVFAVLKKGAAVAPANPQTPAPVAQTGEQQPA